MRTLDAQERVPQCFLPDLLEHEQADDLTVLRWFYANNAEVDRALSSGFQTYTNWRVLAEAYMLGIGVMPNEQRALEAMKIAAQGAISIAMATFSRIADSCLIPRRDRSNERLMLWLSYGMRNGYRECMDGMRDLHPRLYQTTKRILTGRPLFSHQYESLLLGMGSSTFQHYRHCTDVASMQPETMDSLFEHSSPYGITILHTAAAFGDDETLSLAVEIKSLLSSSEIDQPEAKGRTPAWFAVESENPLALEYLLSRGANADHCDGQRHSLLHRVTMLPDPTACAMAEVLIKHGARINPMAFERGEAAGDVHTRYSLAICTPLMWAVFRHRPKLFTLLLLEHYKQNVAIQSELWMVILQRISIYHHVDILETLLTFEQTSTNMPNPRGLIQNAIFQVTMLRWSVHEFTHHMLGCRFELGGQFYTRQRSFISKILAFGGDPLASGLGERGGSAMAYAFDCGDRQAIELFLDHLEAKGVDIMNLLLTHDIPGATFGLEKLINARSIVGFTWVLERFPQLANAYVHALKAHILHIAVTLGQVERVQALLDAGADRYNINESIDATALETAVEAEKLDIADILVRGADVERLMGSPSKYGNTLFARLLNRTFSSRTRIKLKTFQWLQRHDAVQFFPNVPFPTQSLWHFFFSNRFVARCDVIQGDLQLLDFLTQPDTFLDKLHTTDATGQAVLHYAARWGNYETVKMLVERGANINQGVAHVTNASICAPSTATALQFASMVSVAMPQDVRQGGASVIKLWEEDSHKKTRYLEAQGGLRGRYQRLLDRTMFGTEWYDPKTVGFMQSGRVVDASVWEGQWPAPLREPLPQAPVASLQLPASEQRENRARLEHATETHAGVSDESLASRVANLDLQDEQEAGENEDARESPAPISNQTEDAHALEIFQASERLAAGTATERDLDALLDWQRRRLSRANHPTESSSHEAEDREQPAEESDAYDPEEEADDEISTEPAGMTNERMERYIQLLKQKRFTVYMRAYFAMMREHDPKF